MDLPILLEKFTFVEGVDQIKQTLIEILTAEKREFLQDPKTGSVAPIHLAMSFIATDTYLTGACNQVPGCELVSFEQRQEGERLILDVYVTYSEESIELQLTEEGWQ